MDPGVLAQALPVLERAAGALSSQSVARMDDTLPWFRSLPADQRSWVALVAHNGVRAFASWLRDPSLVPATESEDIFANAPRELTRNLTLEQTLALIRVTIEVIEEQVPRLVPQPQQDALMSAVLRYSRDIAFAAATVYARAAETRGAWDTRLQALLVDALLSNDPDSEIASRAAALGWSGSAPIAVAVGNAPHHGADPGSSESTLDAIARAARKLGVETLASVHDYRLIVVVAGAVDPVQTVASLASEFGDGPIVVGDPVASLPEATLSARTAEAGARVVSAWPAAPRPVSAADLLPERALSGDRRAQRSLITDVFQPLAAAGEVLLETLTVYLESGTSLEATARELFVHPNTVRYRLRRIATVCDVSPTESRGAFALRIALALGRLDRSPQL